MVTEDKPGSATAGSVVVYLCGGRTVVVPDVARVLLGDDDLVCKDCQGVERARFRTADVYMCTRSRVPVAPLE